MVVHDAKTLYKDIKNICKGSPVVEYSDGAFRILAKRDIASELNVLRCRYYNKLDVYWDGKYARISSLSDVYLKDKLVLHYNRSLFNDSYYKFEFKSMMDDVIRNYGGARGVYSFRYYLSADCLLGKCRVNIKDGQKDLIKYLMNKYGLGIANSVCVYSDKLEVWVKL